MSVALLMLLAVCRAVWATKRPHIILLLADDLGWNDVGWNNQDIETPNMDKLARGGVLLNQSYSQPVCSPSRAALLTGYYPIHTGMQHGVVQEKQPKGVPLNVTLLPEYLRDYGYRTHAIGKWHLGYCCWEYTPTHRGFDTFYGMLLGAGNYFNHTQGPRDGEWGLDFRDGEEVVRDQTGVYSSVSFANRAIKVISEHNASEPLFLYVPFQSVHSPLQVPWRFERRYRHVADQQRRVYSGMVTAMDEAIGQILAGLEMYDMLRDSVIVFLSDNGGPPYFGANNWPLRGAKTTLWEGGTRTPGFVYSNLLKKKGYTYSGMVHLVDWLPTFVGLAGGRVNATLDGVDQWSAISQGRESPRNEILYNIDNLKKHGKSAAIRVGDYKLIVGHAGKYSDWYQVSDKMKFKKWWQDKFRQRRLKKLKHERMLKKKLQYQLKRMKAKQRRLKAAAKYRMMKKLKKQRQDLKKKQSMLKKRILKDSNKNKPSMRSVNRTMFRGVWNWVCCKTKKSMTRGALYRIWKHFCCNARERCCPSCDNQEIKQTKRGFGSLGHHETRAFQTKVWHKLQKRKNSTQAASLPPGGEIMTRRVSEKLWKEFFEDRIKYGVRLYNLSEDPLERHNLAKSKPEKVRELLKRLHRFELSSVPAVNPPSVHTQEASPSHYGNVWSPGWC